MYSKYASVAGSIFTATRSVPGKQASRQVAYAWPETCKEACKGSRQGAYAWLETCKEACKGSKLVIIHLLARRLGDFMIGLV